MVTKRDCIENDNDGWNLAELVDQNTAQFDMNLLIQWRPGKQVRLHLQPSCPRGKEERLAKIMAGLYAGSGWSCRVTENNEIVFS